MQHETMKADGYTTGDHQPEEEAKLSRRRFLQLSAAALSLPLLASCHPITAPGAASPTNAAAVAQPTPTGAPTMNGGYSMALPTEVQETLTLRFADYDGKKRMMYEGAKTPPRIPGPTLRVGRGANGGKIELLLRNHLDMNTLDPEIDKILLKAMTTDDPDLCPPHGPMVSRFGLRATNIHTHGLHVAPDQAATEEFADNVFVALLPKGETGEPPCEGHDDIIWRNGEAAYRFDIRPDHPPGTFWYHAHKHGSVSFQLQQGLYGALIIGEEERDGIPAYIRHATEHVIFFTDDNIWLNEQGDNLVDYPILIQPGEVQRWRIINASPEAPDHIGLRFTTPNIEMHLIAFDGLMLCERRQVTAADFTRGLKHLDANKDWAVLAPGNRADFLVRVTPGTPEGVADMRTLAFENGPQRREEQDFAIVMVGNEPVNSPWDDDPKLAPPPLPDLMATAVDYQRVVEFGQPRENEFMIEHTSYKGAPLEPPMRLGTVEEWVVRVKDETRAGPTLIHPFHIHVNPFFVTHHNGVPLPDGHPRRRWQDTIAIPPKGSITFRSRFDNFAGDFVIHCHNLRHEDRGMMHKVRVVDPNAPVAANHDASGAKASDTPLAGSATHGH